MTELNPCPFCGSNDLSRYRYNVSWSADPSDNGYTINESPNGEIFCIQCNNCDCKKTCGEDNLTIMAEDSPYNYTEITDRILWRIMASLWNRRVIVWSARNNIEYRFVRPLGEKK